jgi:hypothetical protein
MAALAWLFLYGRKCGIALNADALARVQADWRDSLADVLAVARISERRIDALEKKLDIFSTSRDEPAASLQL